MKHVVTLALAWSMLSACASTDPMPTEKGKVAQSEGYAPTGTYIKRKDGTGLGAAPITAVDKTSVENARAMQSNGLAGIGKPL